MKMEVGDKKDIEVKPEDGFGQRDAKLVRTVPRKVFKDQKVEPRQGMIVDFGGMKGRIQSVDAGRIRVDFNNPLAGHVLKYHLEIKEKIEGDENKVKSILQFFGARDVVPVIKEKAVDIPAAIHPQLKQKISELILEYIKTIEKVNFVESFGKKSE